MPEHTCPAPLDKLKQSHEESYDTRMLWPGYWYFMMLLEKEDKEK